MPDSLTSFPVALFSSFSLIVLAEMGDKSQLVCMTLAARYRPWPVLFGAIVAFALLNLVAVVFGAAVARWLPETVVLSVVGAMFILFGLHALRQSSGQDGQQVDNARGTHSLFFSTLLLITVAEFGDKTQLAVAGLGSTADPVAVWLGSTLALAVTSGLGVLAGRTIMQRLSISLLHKLSGGVFIVLGLVALLSLID
ncbi:MAG: TMEM165/GDT1 family protein [Thiotrichales bacterium]|nr:MAG: TMEM165/GDT1 family protein [Thiotrichales bacterium]